MSTFDDAIRAYQCNGCLYSSTLGKCKKAELHNVGCRNHSISQTRISGGGSGVLHGVRLGGSGNIAPGLGPGFEVFPIEMRTFRISQNFESSAVPIAKPVLKMLDQLENTLVRWSTPEKYGDFTTVFLGDVRAYFADTPEVANAQLKPFVG